MQADAIFYFVVLIVSVILHEVAHGYMANWLGDPTARLAGRLTLNPVSHIDPVGTIFLPLVFLLTSSPFFIGYAKPVPYNPYNIKNKYGELLVAGAGPGTNIALAVVFGLLLRFGGVSMTAEMLHAFALIVEVNLVLALFNLIPIPPLDGSKVLSGILGNTAGGRVYNSFRTAFEQTGMVTGVIIILIIFYYVLSPYFIWLIRLLFSLLTGISI